VDTSEIVSLLDNLQINDDLFRIVISESNPFLSEPPLAAPLQPIPLPQSLLKSVDFITSWNSAGIVIARPKVEEDHGKSLIERITTAMEEFENILIYILGGELTMVTMKRVIGLVLIARHQGCNIHIEASSGDSVDQRTIVRYTMVCGEK